MSLQRTPTLLALVLASAPTASAAAPPGSPLRPPPLQPEMRSFAERSRELQRRREGVSPIRAPVDYGTATNRFGAQRGGHVHAGQDVFAPTGTPLRAVHDAVVLEAGRDGARGNYVAFFAARPRRTYVYLHMAQPAAVRAGERVRAGQRIGAVGCTGSCDGAHLHLEVYAGRGTDGRGLDPLPQLRRWRKS